MKLFLVLLSLFIISGCVPNPVGSKSSKSTFDTNFYPFMKLPGAFTINSALSGDSSVVIAWSSSSNSNSYDLLYKPATSSSLTTIEGVETPFTLSGLTNGQNYNIYIRAKNIIGNRETSPILLMPISSLAAPPVVSSFSSSLFEDVTSVLTLAYVDVNGDAAVSCSVTALSNVTVNQACNCTAGVCTVGIRGSPHYSGAASFDFTVTTDQVSNTGSATLAIVAVDDAPVADNLTPPALNIAIQEMITLTYTDQESDAATSCIISATNNLSVTTPCSCSLGLCTVGVTSSTYVDGTASFNYSVIANGASSNTAAVSFAVNPPGLNPILSYSGSTGTTVTFGNSMLVTPSHLDPNGSSVINCVASPTLPAWASIDTSTCTISGTPTAIMSGTTYTVTASNANGASPGATVTLTVNGTSPTLSYAGSTGTTVNFGSTMNVVPTTLNPNGSPVTSCLSSPALPSWADLSSSTCTITGVPNASLPATTFTITAVNAIGSSAGSIVTLEVNALVPNLSYSSSTGTTGVVGSPLSVSPSTLNANGEAITNCTSSPSLPAWATLNPTTCQITGTPTATLAASTFNITASNSIGSSLSAPVTLTVNTTVPTLSYSGALGTNSFVDSPVSVTPTTLLDNGSPITGCTSTPALPLWASIDPNTCVISGTPDAILAPTTYVITATNAVGTSAGANVTLTMSAFVCPGGYVEAPANNLLNVSRFCVMEFEAKDVASVATSQASGTPWTSIAQGDAKTSCTSLGSDFDLISNPEWITIARDAEAVASNWTGGVGTGSLPRGHSDGTPVGVLAVSNTADPFSDTGEITGEQRRTLTLSNGSVIWDFGGNASEWVDWSMVSGMQSGPITCDANSYELPSVVCAALNSNDYLPSNTALNSLNGIGSFFGGPGGATVRGGHWNEGDVAGSYSLNLNYTTTADSNVGFRCVNRPRAEAPPEISYVGATGTNGFVNEIISVFPTTLEANGSAISSCVSSPALPAWATLDPNTCEISGTPTAALSATYTITASNAAGSSTGASVTLTIDNSIPELSYSGALGTSGAVDVPMSITPTLLDDNGSVITSCSITPTLPTWAIIDSTTCVISGTPDNVLIATTFTVTATNAVGPSAGASVTISVEASAPSISYVGASGTIGNVGSLMTVTPTLLDDNGSVITSCSISPALPGWASLNATSCEISGTPNSILSSTTYYVTATNSQGSSTAAEVSLRVNASAPSLDYSGSSGTTVNFGSPMNVVPSSLQDNGSPITSCTSSPALPAWATLDSSTCVISGTPNTTLSAVTYTITAANSTGPSVGAPVTLTVNATAPSISYSGASGTTGFIGSPMAVSPTSLSENGSAITNCSITPALPAWATINTSTCEISGTPTAVLASTTYSVTATNSVGNSSAASVTLTVNAAPPTISYAGATGTTGTFGVAMNVSPTTLDDNGSAITNCTSSPALPAWATINTSTCVISGTPNSTLSSTSYSITATNSAGSSTAATVSLTVNAAPPSLSYDSSTGMTINYGQTLNVAPSTLNTNGASITGCSITPALPAWATINTSTCVISGTATNSLAATVYSVTASNSAGSSTSANVTLTVNPLAPTLSYTGAAGTNGAVAVPMSVTPTTLNSNGAAISNCSSSPALPAWATLNTSTCEITGTPDAVQMATVYTITAANSAGNSSGADVTLSVAASAPTLSYFGASGTSGTVGSPMSVSPTTLNDNGAAITNCTITPALPAWASINTSTCEISGTPTAVMSSVVYTVTAANSAGSSAGSSVTLLVNAQVPTISYSGATGTTINGDTSLSVAPTTLEGNGAAVTSCSASPALPAWAIIDQSTCVISGTPTSGLNAVTYTITASNSAGSSTGAAVTLTVNPVAPDVSYAGATGTTGYVGTLMTVSPTTLNSNAADITNCTITPALPAWATISPTTCVISGTPSATLSLTAYTVTAINSAGSSTGAAVSLSVENLAAPNLSYSGAVGTSGLVNTLMSVSPTTLEDNGSPITACSITPALPAWATINSSTCVISGTPTATLASTTYTVTATNSQGSSPGAAVTLSVAADVPTLSYSGVTGNIVTVGDAMSVSPTAFDSNGAAITNCSSSPAMPSGLTLNTTTCEISGNPTTIQSATTYTITATNSVGSTSASVSLTVQAEVPEVSFTGATGTTGNVGTSMTITPTTLDENGSAITNCSITPTLPSGLTIDVSTCVISGTPTVMLSSTTYTVTATNALGPSTGAAVTLTVNAAVPTLSYSGSTGTTVNYGAAMTVTPSTLQDNGSPITGCTSSPTLPSWASLNATTCEITGTPDAALASTSYTITATNSAGSSAGASVTLTVNPLAPVLSYSGATGTTVSSGSPLSVSPTTLDNRGAAITNCTSSPALPSWATLSSTTCTITGTPTSPQSTTTYTITAVNSVGSSTGASVDITVTGQTPSISYVGSTGTSGTVTVPMSVSPTTLNDNGYPITNCQSSPALPTWATLDALTCAITGTPDSVLMATIYTITVSNSQGDSTAEVTLSVAASVPTISYAASTGRTGNVGSYMEVIPSTLEDNGAAITSCSSSPALPAWATLNQSTCVITGTPTETQPNTGYTITATNSEGSSDGAYVALRVDAAVPVISYSSSTGVTIDFGQSFNVAPSTLEDNGSAITACTSTPTLPAWATLNQTTCVITGTPPAAQAGETYSITASNSSGTSAGSLVTLTVNALVPELSYASSTGTTSFVGTAMTITPSTFNENGNTVTSCSSVPALPAGLTLDQNTCVISGIPDVVINAETFTITASNSAGSSTGAPVTLTADPDLPEVSFAATEGIPGYIDSPMIAPPSTLRDNGSPITGCTITPSLPAWATFDTTTCEISGTPTAVMASTDYTVEVTNGLGSSNTIVSLSVLTCPDGFVEVPEDLTLGVSRFCVMQYEARDDAGDASTDPLLYPRNSITLDQAQLMCVDMNDAYEFDLISNPEWMAISRNIETTPSNWSGGSVGSGMIPRGHTDNVDYDLLNIANEANPYDGTGNDATQTPGSGWEQKRTFTLSNGSVIWDFGGNLFEWVDWSPTTGMQYSPECLEEGEFFEVNCPLMLTTDYMPSDSALTNTSGIGFFFGGAGAGGTVRGGDSAAFKSYDGLPVFTNEYGIYTIEMGQGLLETDVNTGFRCVFRP